MKLLVLVRHGESEWNLKNQFTGWMDVDLSNEGVRQASEAGVKIKEAGFKFDVAYTSVLKRAIKTLHYILENSDQLYIPEYKTYRLNERHYGALQGLNKAETAEKYGDDMVKLWRRSYDTLPPLLEKDDERSSTKHPAYALLDENDIPMGENLKITLERVLPFYQDTIVKQLKQNKNVLVAAHGNSFRALVKHLDKLSDDEIMAVEIPTGKPLVYELNDDLTVNKKYYL